MTTPTTAECDAWRAQLTELEAAAVKIATGGLEVMVQMGENRVQYSPAKLSDLQAVIGRLRGRIAGCSGCGGRRLIGVIPS